MIVFCLLWIPLVLLFRRALGFRTRSSAGLLTAVLLGLAAATLRHLAGPLLSPAGFGPSLFLYSLVDAVALPALLPLAFRSAFALGSGEPAIEYGEFALFWLTPVAVLHAVFWSARPEPLHLVLVPLLWSSVALGVPYLVRRFREEIGALSILALLAAVLLPFAAGLSYQAFFSHRALLGAALLVPCLLPMAVESALAMPAALRSDGSGFPG